MSYCQSVCDVPCGVSYGYGGVGSCGVVPVYGGGALSGGWGAGGALSRAGGWLGQGPVACSGQLAGSEVVIQPPASVVSIPGPVISTGDPAVVSAYSPCTGYGYPALGSGGGFSSGSSSGGYGRLGYSGRYGGGYGGGYGSGYCGGYGSGYGGYGRWRRYSQKCIPFYRSGSCGPC
ncbi:claw keratin [Anolis carolinensis]|uniref:claw keratin n=1 Tax=Anolis carolinensis TaxID=28377 RepID=UPI000203A6EB|nr:PREDICTED: claw keratin-like [Anolis carolinensis]|eukprot:XP_003226392.1 PREDICTED: claw keratin-like [Anolis carolinensis]